MGLIDEYLKLTEKYKEEYGNNTILLMQVGAFYEMYGLKDKKTNNITGSRIVDFSKFCDLAISDKKMCVGKKNVMMSGFRDYNLDKYLNKIQKNNFTAVVYSQDEKAAGTTRSLTGIYSPGTYFSNNEEKLTNNITCIWIEKCKNKIIVGCSNIDNYTGKSHIFEYITQYSNSPTPYDELERFISIFNPSEAILLSNMTELDMIISYCGLKTECIHKINTVNDSSTMSKRANNCEKQTYQDEIIKRFFGCSLFTYGDFVENNIAVQSFCFLLDFVYQHNPNMVSKIKIPVFENCSDRLILANHSLSQLNMINAGENNGKLSSVSNFLNNCITPMGKRNFNLQLMNPSKDINYLKDEYKITDYIIKNVAIESVRNKLDLMRDIEKLNRKLVLKKITPYDFFHLSETIQHIIELYSSLTKDEKLNTYIHKSINTNIKKNSNVLINKIKSIFEIDVIKEINTLEFEENFIKRSYDSKHDMLVKLSMDSYDKLECIREFLHKQVSKYETNKKNNQLIKIHQTDKMGFSLIGTKRRISILKNDIKSDSVELTYHSRFDKTNCVFSFNTGSLIYRQTTGSNYTIESDQIIEICKDIILSKSRMTKSLTNVYNNFIVEMINHTDSIDDVVMFTRNIDIIFCKSYTAKKYDYCKPDLDNNRDKSFVEFEGLRHPLIEQLLCDELYVKNDLQLNSDTLGILLYGTNAVGKSSFIKAIGISLIMAQAGMFVPCSSFVFKPYSYLFTRILGNDNIFKGLSTFEVEMLELKTILNLADKNSLILGDELCSGTETDSAISIFLAGINCLYNLNSNFIFATHFHEIVNYEEITNKNKLYLKHMSVVYDSEQDTLIYDRLLKDGSGESMYGLEVCKSLHLPIQFVKEAHVIRSKYNPIKKSILDMKTSRYNSKKIKSICEMCKNKMATEIHHLQHQKNANENGYIDGFHKNHLANLFAVCEECHHLLHDESEGHVKVKTSDGLNLKNVC